MLVRNFWEKREKLRRTWSHKLENSFKRAYGEVEDNIIIYIERLKT